MQRIVFRNLQKSMMMGTSNRVMMQRCFSSQFGVDKNNIPAGKHDNVSVKSVRGVTSVDADQPINFPPVEVNTADQ
jgi:hypothetical protein